MMATVAERLSGLEKDVARLQEDVGQLQDTNGQILGLVGQIVELTNRTVGVQRQLIGRFDKLEQDMKEYNRGQMESLGRIENLCRNPNY